MKWVGFPLIGVFAFCSMRLCARLSLALGDPKLAPALWLAIIGAWVAISTEALSIAHAINPTAIFIAWFTLTLVLAAAEFSKREQEFELFPLPAFSWPLVGIAVLLACTLALALIAPPNNADSLGYHSARIMHWLDQNSVAHYVTSDSRQVRMPPLSSYVRLHLFSLCDSDVLFNFVQWVAYFLCILFCWLATESAEIGLFSAVFCATVPMAILQASSAQNDLITASFALAAMLTATRLKSKSSFLIFWTLLGLGALTKGTFYVYGGILAIAALPAHLRAIRSQDKFFAPIALGIAVAVGLNVPHLVRNEKLFHEAAPSSEAISLRAWTHHSLKVDAAQAVSQVVRTVALQLDVLKKVPGLSWRIPDAVVKIEDSMGLPRWEPAFRFNQMSLRDFYLEPLPHEDYAGSAWHFLLIVFALFCWKRGYRAWAGVGLCSALAIVLLVKWMPWNNRLLLPAVLLFSPVVATAIPARARSVVMAALFVLSIPYVLFDYAHPVIAHASTPSFLSRSRWENYFGDHAQARQATEKALRALPASCSLHHPVSLADTGNEYLLWAGSRQFLNPPRDLRFRYAAPGACAVLETCGEGGFCLKPERR